MFHASYGRPGQARPGQPECERSDSERPCPCPTAAAAAAAARRSAGGNSCVDGSVTGSLDNLHLVGWLELVLHLLNAKLFRVANEKLMARLDIQMRLLALDYGVHLEMPFQGRNQPVLLSRSFPVSLPLFSSFPCCRTNVHFGCY